MLTNDKQNNWTGTIARPGWHVIETSGQVTQPTLTLVPSKTAYTNYSVLSPNFNNENDIIVYGAFEEKFPLNR